MTDITPKLARNIIFTTHVVSLLTAKKQLQGNYFYSSNHKITEIQ